MNQMRQEHITRPLFPHNHTREYLMHKFWSRKPHNIVAAYIWNYSKPGEVVLDPFGGSGVTANEALRLGRRVVSFDANPLSTFITRNTIARVDIAGFEGMARDVYSRVAPSISQLYSTPCPSCKGDTTVTHVLWRDMIECRCGNMITMPGKSPSGNLETRCGVCGAGDLASERRVSRPGTVYYTCAECGQSIRPATPNDAAAQADLEASPAYQRAACDLPSLDMPLVYPNGAKFIQLRHDIRYDPRLRHLFTARNFLAIHSFWKAIAGIPAGDDTLRVQKDMLWFLFSSMLPQASKMVWVIKKRKDRDLARCEVGSWTHHFFWNPTEFFEVNVLNGFRERLSKFMGGLRSRSTWWNGGERWCAVYLDDPSTWWLSRKTAIATGWHVLGEAEPVGIEPASSAADFFNDARHRKNALVETRSAEQLGGIPDASIDYIFTDPPYGDSIQYGELATFFLAWLEPQNLPAELRNALDNEITINQGQGKDFRVYQRSLELVFKECHRVLKPGRHMTITFHDTDSRIRGAIYEVMHGAGFTFQRTVYQPPPRPSEKSLLHERGSPTGDYIITFMKPETGGSDGPLMFHDDGILLRRAIDAIFARRGEPVPFNLLLSLLDLQLAEMGYLPPDIRHPLDRFLHGEPDYHLFEKEGWFFTNEAARGHDLQPPLSDKIAREVTRVLPRVKHVGKTGRIETITNAVFSKLNGVLTPSLKDLKRVAARAIDAQGPCCREP